MVMNTNGMTPFLPIKSMPKLKTLAEVITYKDRAYIDESFMSEGRWSIDEELFST